MKVPPVPLVLMRTPGLLVRVCIYPTDRMMLWSERTSTVTMSLPMVPEPVFGEPNMMMFSPVHLLTGTPPMLVL